LGNHKNENKMENTILPVINNELLQQKANECAQKGAEECIKEFYTGHNSPYKKAIEENLLNKGFDHQIAIPDIIGILNESFSKEVDLIANNAISKSFIPLVKDFLTRAKSEYKLSEILQKFIECTDFDHDVNDMDDYSLETVKDEGSFTYLKISNGDRNYEVHFYNSSNRSEETKTYEIYRLPNYFDKESRSKYGGHLINTMKLTIDNITLEMPFVSNVLEDSFVSFISKLVIANSKIIFDVNDFNEDMFPEREHCYCD
jgi:hypothetical protein